MFKEHFCYQNDSLCQYWYFYLPSFQYYQQDCLSYFYVCFYFLMIFLTIFEKMNLLYQVLTELPVATTSATNCQISRMLTCRLLSPFSSLPISLIFSPSNFDIMANLKFAQAGKQISSDFVYLVFRQSFILAHLSFNFMMASYLIIFGFSPAI